MKKVLVTGANGFIGRHTLVSLLNKGYEVHALGLSDPNAASADYKMHVVDLLDYTQLRSLLKTLQPSHLLHFAWDVTPGEYWNSIKNFSWVQVSLELLQTFQEMGGRRVVMAGTCAEYDWRFGYCSELVTPTIPVAPYGVCKLALQTMLDAFSEKTGLSSAWGRIFFLFGPYEHSTRLVPSVIRSLLSGQPACCSHGNQIRDFLYVQDVADAFVSLLDSDVRGPVNIASGQPAALKDVIYCISEQINRSDLVRLGAIDVPEHDPSVILADTQRLTNEIGWMPKYSLKDGLEQTIHWWSNILRSQNE